MLCHSSLTRYLAVRVVGYARARVHFARALWRCDFSILLPPWSQLRRDGSVVGRLRRIAIATLWERVAPLPDRVMLVVFGLFWPLHSAARALQLVRLNGRAVKRMAGISPLQQWWEAVALAIVHNYSPVAYFQFRLFDRARSPWQFVQEGEFFMLQVRDNAGVDLGVLNQKLRFHDECVRVGLPTPPIIAVFGFDEERWIDAPGGELPRHSLFLKWQDGEQGLGYERWHYDADREQWTRHGVMHRHDAMLEHCRMRGATRDLIVQPVIHNHPEIDRLNAGALCTLRVMTYRNPSEPAALIRACFKIARAGSDVDNLHAGGLACPVDAITGELGPASGSFPVHGVHSRNPDNGAAIAGVRLPDFHAATELALAAHERISVPWSVGWDVAITSYGPVLLEGNPMWAADLGQAPHGEPFETGFMERLLARLQPADRNSAADPPLLLHV